MPTRQLIKQRQIEAEESTQSPAIQAVMKQETLLAIRALRPQLEMSTRLSGAMLAGKRTIFVLKNAKKYKQNLNSNGYITIKFRKQKKAHYSFIQYAIYVCTIYNQVLHQKRNNKLKVTIHFLRCITNIVEFYDKMLKYLSHTYLLKYKYKRL